jgi:uncharacterized membrane protein YuzA (DUF378 family)
MLSVLLRAVAFILFLVGAFNQTLFGQGELDLVCFGLAAWVLATLLGGYGPGWPRQPTA